MNIEKTVGLLRLFGWNSKLSISKAMAYRTDFLTDLFLSLIFTSMGPVVQYLLFTQTSGYPGWNLEQILFFQGILLLSLGINNMIFGEVRNKAIEIMHKGDFDRYLLKPYSSAGVLLTSGFSLNQIGSVLAGLVITVVMAVRMQLPFHLLDIVLFGWFFAAGLLVYIAMNLIFCGAVIVLVQMGRLNQFFDNIMRFSGYPNEIYPHLLRLGFLTFLPLSVFAYFPAQALLHRIDSSMLWASCGVLILVIFSLWFWNSCLKKYTSAGG